MLEDNIFNDIMFNDIMFNIIINEDVLCLKIFYFF